MWTIKEVKKLSNLKNPVFVEGMPGIGNVGKIVTDFLIQELKAELTATFHSDSLPNAVYVKEDNLVSLPKIELYHRKLKSQDLLILTGDVQPSEESASWQFCQKVLDYLKTHKVDTIITTGGIGLVEEPKKPIVYITGNNKEFIKNFKKDTELNDKIYGIVGPVIGAAGLLVGMAGKKKAIALLAQTLAHPTYLGMAGASQIIKTLNKKYSLEVDTKKLEREIEKFNKELKEKTIKLQKKANVVEEQSTNYIG
ncbi:hypothetical protein GOV04_05335 [Candidatus Woesearchaeota archaeon]|nr:hypothetical protein [Candidatus Woesearchaeota archaeon]